MHLALLWGLVPAFPGGLLPSPAMAATAVACLQGVMHNLAGVTASSCPKVWACLCTDATSGAQRHVEISLSSLHLPFALFIFGRKCLCAVWMEAIVVLCSMLCMSQMAHFMR